MFVGPGVVFGGLGYQGQKLIFSSHLGGGRNQAYIHFSWLSRYNKTRRSQGPDYEGVALYHCFLRPLLELSPSGLPNYASIREAVKLLDEAVGLNKHEMPTDPFLMQAATRLKLMSQHVGFLVGPSMS